MKFQPTWNHCALSLEKLLAACLVYYSDLWASAKMRVLSKFKIIKFAGGACFEMSKIFPSRFNRLIKTQPMLTLSLIANQSQLQLCDKGIRLEFLCLHN
jgi:hypothetical protein